MKSKQLNQFMQSYISQQPPLGSTNFADFINAYARHFNVNISDLTIHTHSVILTKEDEIKEYNNPQKIIIPYQLLAEGIISGELTDKIIRTYTENIENTAKPTFSLQQKIVGIVILIVLMFILSIATLFT